jgi:hypothetical protein
VLLSSGTLWKLCRYRRRHTFHLLLLLQNLTILLKCYQNDRIENVTTSLYRVSTKSFPDYKHLLQENYVEYKYNFLNVTQLKKFFFCNTLVHLDDWLTVRRSITLVNLQLDAQNSYLFTYNTFIKILIFCAILVGFWEWVVTLLFLSRNLSVVCLWLNYSSTV